LWDQSDMISKHPEMDVFDILCIEQNSSIWRIIEAFNQLDDSRFAGARWPHDGSGVSSFDLEVSVLKYWFVLDQCSGILKRDVIKMDKIV
jgi:hypothetical protein